MKRIAGESGHRILKTAALAGIAALLLSGCATSGKAAEPKSGEATHVTIGLLQTGMTTLPAMRLADDPALQKKYGLDIGLKFYTNPQLPPAMASGEVDATLATPSNMAALAGQGASVQLAGTVASDESEVLLGTGDEITSASQLKGKRITALASSGTWRTLQAQIDAKFGTVAGKDYQVISVNDLASGAAQVVAGTADYALAWEPFATQAMSLSDKLHIVLTPDALKDYDSWQFVVGVQADLAEKVKENLVKALGEAGEWIHSNPEEADKAYSKKLNYESGVITSVLNGKLLAFDIHGLTADDQESLLVDLKRLTGVPVPKDSFFDTFG